MSLEVQTGALVRLVLTVDREAAGGVVGLVPTVAIRDPAVAGSYLDWADGVFKLAGWTTRLGVMAEVDAALSPGAYGRAMDLSLVPAAIAGFEFVAEFAANNGYDVDRRGHEHYVVRESVNQLDWVHAVHRNRIEDAPGTPGVVQVYRADSVTVWRTAELRDYVGAGVGGTSGLPARRTRFA